MTKHVIAFMEAAVAGKLASPFLNVAGKQIYAKWWGSVESAFHGKPRGIVAKLLRDGWYTFHGAITAREDGSVKRDLLVSSIKPLA